MRGRPQPASTLSARRWRGKGHQIVMHTEADLVDSLAETRTSGVRESALV
ncbi:hypothetical protein [Geodermatophilus sp. TF02-6]|nr:hypothetical protein [Geodermatophilus sp. TF02-6]